MSSDPGGVPDWTEHVEDPAAEPLSELCTRLAALDGTCDESGEWPEPLWSLLVEFGAPLWSVPMDLGPEPCERTVLLQRYARIAEGSLTAAFILSQHEAGVRRLLAAADREAAQAWLAKIASGQAFATVGIAQLTTSRRHGTEALTAWEVEGGYRLNGIMPWVTAAIRADVIVGGAVTDDGRQVLLAVPTDRPGLSVRPPFPLAALQASCTSEVDCAGVHLLDSDVLAGPSDDVLAAQAGPGSSTGAGTGGLETSALAIGQARAALVALANEFSRRADLGEPLDALNAAWRDVRDSLLSAALAAPDAPTPGQVRAQANALVLRITQAYLAARKGSGFLRTEPAQRWARQALFFLVWSCPGPVAQATIRDLAGICDS
jgi:alkylation response protein AidB-like acyl-CoA dehydrogenase